MNKKNNVIRLFSLGILLAASTLMINSCNDEKIKPAATSKEIDGSGGTLAGSDGVVSVNIPAGALGVNTAITIKISDETAPTNGIGKVYTLTPDGVQFTKPVKLSFQYSDKDALTTPPSSMAIAFKKPDNTWQLMPTVELDKVTHTITTETTHFSQWTLLQVPTVSSFEPLQGTVGTVVKITGDNFSATPSENIVLINGINATITSSATNEIVFILPIGATTGKLIVQTIFKQLSYTVTSSTDFTVESSEPVITSFTPSTGPVGTVVTITGKNFSSASSENKVLMNGIQATVASSTATQIVFVVPAGATTGKFIVQTIFNKLSYNVTSPTDFTIETNEPVITSFTPSTGPVGTVVTITGKNFSTMASENKVLMNGIQATVTSSNTTQIVFVVPVGAITGKFFVQTIFNTLNYTVVSPTDFTVN
jgi:hypothetical protein